MNLNNIEIEQLINIIEKISTTVGANTGESKLKEFNAFKSLLTKAIPKPNFKEVRGILLPSILEIESQLGLVVGNRYIINELVAGDDFTNVGFVEVGVIFEATGTTPTTWVNSTVVYDVDNSTIGETLGINTYDDLQLEIGWNFNGTFRNRIVFKTTGEFLVNKNFKYFPTGLDSDIHSTDEISVEASGGLIPFFIQTF